MDERISVDNQSLFKGYANHIQRYAFAENYCRGKRVLDAGCGTGYGSYYLALNAASSVVALDISEQAVQEARRYYRRDNLEFLLGDVERLREVAGLEGMFDVLINLENIEHLNDPGRFLGEARHFLSDEGILVTSTPNGQLTVRGRDGSITNPFHMREYTEGEFRDLLEPTFPRVDMFGQWRTPEGRFRMAWDRMVFDHIIDMYYNPMARIWRVLKRAIGRGSPPPPKFIAAGSSYPWEYTILPYSQAPYPWPPEVLLAVCRVQPAVQDRESR